MKRYHQVPTFLLTKTSNILSSEKLTATVQYKGATTVGRKGVKSPRLKNRPIIKT